MRHLKKRLIFMQLIILALAQITAVSARAAASDPGPSGASWRATRVPQSIPPPNKEMSGLASSRRYPGLAWGVRDSGNPAALYAIRLGADGRRTFLREIPVVGATNRDWEDVVYEEVGPAAYLYVIDTGSHRIYKIREPAPGSAKAAVEAVYPYAFPDSNPASTCGPAGNVEAAFLFPPLTGRLHLVRKMGNPALVYRFDVLRPGRRNVPTRVGALADAHCISVASVSDDRRMLFTASHSTLVVRQGRGDLASLLSGRVLLDRSISPDNTEGGDFYPWGSRDILLVAENRTIWHLTRQ